MAVVVAVAVMLFVGMAAAEVPATPDYIMAATGNFWVNHTWGVGHSGWYLISGEYYGGFYGFAWAGSTWQSDSGTGSGLGDVGYNSAPTVFLKDGTWYLIAGEYYGVFNGYNWTGSAWQSDSGIVSGLGDIGTVSTPTVFQKDGTWYLIAGEEDGVFNGFNWTGSAWQSDSGTVSGLGDVGTESKPSVFQKDGTWYLISGEFDGVFNGYNWTGSAWQSDSGIVSGLGDIGGDSAPTVFLKDGTWYLIAGEYYGAFYGYNWTGSAWQSDSGITSGLGDVGRESAPTVFQKTVVPAITDSYNVSVNSVWYNATTDTHWNDTYAAHAWQNITVYAYNETYGISTGSISQNTQIPNNPVTITNTSDWSGNEGENVYVDYDATDADSDTPTFSCSRIDLFTDFDTATGRGNWTATAGTHYVDFGVSDGWGSTSNYTMTIAAASETWYLTWYLIAGETDGGFYGFNWPGSAWQSNSSIASGLGSSGWNSAPTVFQKDGTRYLISGGGDGAFYGFNQTGSTWQSDPGIVSGLGDVGYVASPTVFLKDGTWYLISGDDDGVFNGYNWTGSAWQSDSGIVSGLGDIGKVSRPTVFLKDGTWYLIAGEFYGAFYGYKWTGSTWQSDPGIVSGLGSIGHPAPIVFQKDGTWYLISGERYGAFYGYKWTGSTWQSDSGITSGLGDIGYDSTPTVFQIIAPATTPPNPTTIANTTGDAWVNHTWSPGVGNVTDSYRVSVNSVWHSTTNTYYNHTYTYTDYGGWQNIMIFAFNSSDTGTLSTGFISQNTEIRFLSAPWWNSDWDCRQHITINNTRATPFTDSFVKVIINASQCYWSDCSDIRFIDTSDNTEIDFYCDADIGGFPDYTSAETVYLKVPYIGANDCAYVDFYFGNGDSVPNTCSGSGTLAFTETFGDENGYLDRWYPNAQGYGYVLPDGVWRGADYGAWSYSPSAKPPCDIVNFAMWYGYYGDRYTLVQPDGAEIGFTYHTAYRTSPGGTTTRSYLLFGCDGDLTYYTSLTPNTDDSYTLLSTAKMHFQVPSYGGTLVPGEYVYIDNIQLIQNDLYMPSYLIGQIETVPTPYIIFYDNSQNIVTHAQLTLQNLDTDEIVYKWKDIADGIIGMGSTTDTFMIAVRTFDGVFVYTNDFRTNPECEIIIPIHYNLKVHPVDQAARPLFDVFCGLSEYTTLNPQAFWGFSMSGSQYVPITNCSGFSMCDLIAEKGGYEDYNVTALNWTSKSALIKDYRHTAVLAKES